MTRDIQALISAYLECALFTATLDRDPNGSGGPPMNTVYSVDDFDSAAHEGAKEDLEEFLKKATEQGIDFSGWTDRQFGHDFWYTRNGHGTGFWDREGEVTPYGDAGARLDKLCDEFPECYVCECGDGYIGIE